jgi:hypothetical protein
MTIPSENLIQRDPQKALPCRNRRRLRYKDGKSTGAFRRRVVTRSVKTKQTGEQKKLQLHHIGQTNPLGRLL